MAEPAYSFDDELAPDFELRPLQRAILEDAARFKVPVIHRRFGKTVTSVEFVKQVKEVPYPDPKGFLVFPFAKQAEEVSWAFLKAATAHIDGVEYDKWRLECRFPEREGIRDTKDVGPVIKLVGAAEYHKHRGKYADRVAFDETPDIPPRAWSQIFRPMLSDADRGSSGRAMFIGTPRGHDWFYDLYHRAAAGLEDWRAWCLTVYDTGVIPRAEIEALQRDLPESDFRQEYLCDWDVARAGAFYQRQLNQLIDEKRNGDVPFDSTERVSTAWFLDKTDTVTVLFTQRKGAMLHVFDAIHEHGSAVAEVCAEVLKRPYVFDKHLCPMLDKESYRLRTARQLGVRLQCLPKRENIDEVEAVRSAMPAMRIDGQRGEDLIEAGRVFHATFDEKRRVFTDEPYNDWSLHWCKALGLAVRGAHLGGSDWSQPIDYPERWRA